MRTRASGGIGPHVDVPVGQSRERAPQVPRKPIEKLRHWHPVLEMEGRALRRSEVGVSRPQLQEPLQASARLPSVRVVEMELERDQGKPLGEAAQDLKLPTFHIDLAVNRSSESVNRRIESDYRNIV